jgi:hypothetical protein
LRIDLYKQQNGSDFEVGIAYKMMEVLGDELDLNPR